MEFKCLAIRQPWAWAIAVGAKDVENRSWSTNYRGPVVLQASSAKTLVNRMSKDAKLKPLDFEYGALIGVADLVDVVPLSESLEANPWSQGPHCWIFRNARAFRNPIPHKGRLNLYTLDSALNDKVAEATALAGPIEHDAGVLRWLEQLRKLTADDRMLFHLESYINLNDGANAVRMATARVETSRTSDTLTDLARGFLTANDLPTALATANDAVSADTANGRALFVRSLIYQSLSDDDRAAAAELNPAFGDTNGAGDDEEAD